MKINETNRIGSINTYRSKNGYSPSSSESKRLRKDEVNISPEAKELLVSQTTDAQKLKELQSKVSAGTYQVDASKLAEKLLKLL